MTVTKEPIIVDHGRNIYLKQLTLDDVSQEYCFWMNDPQVVQYLESRFVVQTIESIRNFVSDCLADEAGIFFGIRLKENNKHIGNIKLHRINRHHQSAEVSIMIGDKNYWGKGLASQAIDLLSSYAFKTLGLHKLSAECYSNNMGSYKAFVKAGYQEEGRRIQQYICEGKYVDSYILGCINS